MLRTVSSPDNWDEYKNVVDIEQGGLSSHSGEEALLTLNGIPKNKIGLPGGAIPIAPDGGINPKFLGNSLSGIPGIDGDRYISAGDTKEYLMTTYDCFTNYFIEAISGTVKRNGNVISYTAGIRPGTGGFIINGRRIEVTIGGNGVLTPDIIYPLMNAINRPKLMEFSASPFAVSGYNYHDAHYSTDWELSKTVNFATIVKSSMNDTVNKTSWEVDDLDLETDYYVRVRYQGTSFGLTEWSSPIHFSTKPVLERAVIVYPSMGLAAVGDKITVVADEFVPDISSVQVPVMVGGSITGYLEETVTSQLNSTDWQISSTSSFSSIDFSGHADGKLLQHEILQLKAGNVYYLRIRHNHLYSNPVSADAAHVITYTPEIKTGEWSDTVIFATLPTFEADQPVIIAPAAATANHGPNTTAMASPYVSQVDDTHVSSDWEVASDASFTTIVKSSYADTENKTSWNITNLPAGSIYFLRIRYKGHNYTEGRWSNIVSFSTLPSYAPVAPSIVSPVANAINQTAAFTVTASNYSSPLAKLHASTDWELSTVEDFSTIAQSSYDDPVNKTSWPLAGLLPDTVYYLRARYKDEVNYESSWSVTSKFTTIQTRPLQPTIVSPVENGVVTTASYLVTGSAFSFTGNVHANSDWEIYDADTNVLLQSSYFDVVNKTSLTMATLPSTHLSIRVRYRTGLGVASAWSLPRKYTQTVS